MKSHFSCLSLSLFLASPAWGQGLLAISNPAHPPGMKLDLELTAQAFVGNDMVPVHEVDRDPWPADYRSRPGANLGLGMLRLDVGGSERGWNLGWFHRQDWLLKSNRDTVDAYVLNQRGQLTGQGRRFDLDYSVRGFAADGLRLGYSGTWTLKPGSGLIWGLSASLLRGRDVHLEEAKGELLSLAGSGSLNGSRRLHNTRLKPVANATGFNDFGPPSPMSVPDGWGWGLDAGLTWYATNGAVLSLAVNDLAGRIEWDRVPLIEEQVNNLTDPYIPGGSAAVTGRNVYAPLSLELKPKFLLEGVYPIGRASLSARLEGLDGEWFPQLGLGYALWTNWRVGMEYDTRFGSLAVNLRHRNYFLELRSQDLDWHASRALGAAAGAYLAF